MVGLNIQVLQQQGMTQLELWSKKIITKLIEKFTRTEFDAAFSTIISKAELIFFRIHVKYIDIGFLLQ